MSPLERERNRRWLAAIVIALAILWAGAPAVSGYHVGYNSATDHLCVSHVVQWCK